MSFLAPVFLVAAGALALAVVALHMLARRPPKPHVLPTARFVPHAQIRAPAIARPTDRRLMLFRIALVLLAGLAFARPVWSPAREVGRVIVLDHSRSVRSAVEVLDSAKAYFTSGDGLVVFTGDTVLFPPSISEIEIPIRRRRAGILSAGLVGALRAAESIRTDSLELVLISAFVDEEWDLATEQIRLQWGGRARLVPVEPATDLPTRVALRSVASDPIAATIALLGTQTGGTSVRLVRGQVSAADSLWAASSGGVLAVWPLDAVGWPEGPNDTVGALVAWDAVTVAPFFRVARPPEGRPVAHWVDGLPAAVERPLGTGCQRDIAIAVPVEGDLVLRGGWRRFVEHLLAPCGGPQRTGPLSPERRSILAGSGALMGGTVSDSIQHATPANVWLLLLALALFAFEPLVRRRGNQA